MLPNLVIAGVNKAATTSLYAYLATHPDICASPIKEVQYFLPLRYGKNLGNINEYAQQFKHCANQKYRLEATGGYFYGGLPVAQAIQAQLDTPKVILLFREPISRLFSYFKFKKSTLELPENITFEAYIEQCLALPPAERVKRENNVYWGVEGGFYANYMEAWLETFNEDALKIIFFEDLKKDMRGVLVTLCQWLDLPYAQFVNSLVFSTENKSVHYKNRFVQKTALTINWYGEQFWRTHPQLKRTLRRIYYAINGQPHTEKIKPETKAMLDSLFQPYNQRLAQILKSQRGLSLPDWLENSSASQQPAKESKAENVSSGR
jgi:Sulfotransferase domain